MNRDRPIYKGRVPKKKGLEVKTCTGSGGEGGGRGARGSGVVIMLFYYYCFGGKFDQRRGLVILKINLYDSTVGA